MLGTTSIQNPSLTSPHQARRIMVKIARAFQHNGDEAGCPVCGRSTHCKPKTSTRSTFGRLEGEHQSILRESHVLLKRVKEVARTNSNKGRTDMSRTLRNLARLNKLVTEHQKREERIIIPIMAKSLDVNASESLRRDHTHILAALGRIRISLVQVNRLTQSKSIHALTKSTAQFNSMAREHFSREENVIYWYASLFLTQQKAHHTSSMGTYASLSDNMN
jgi:hemerythrin-like domain-containing protein